MIAQLSRDLLLFLLESLDPRTLWRAVVHDHLDFLVPVREGSVGGEGRVTVLLAAR